MFAIRTIARLHRIGLALVVPGACLLGIAGGLFAGDDGRSPAVRGEELFARQWRPRDVRSRGGDGLGPVYNDASCIACHNLGAPGGAGPDSKNVDILTAVKSDNRAANVVGRALLGRPPIELLIAAAGGPNPDELVKAHAGFAAARSVVLHRFGTDPGYALWRLQLLGVPADHLEAGIELSKVEPRPAVEMMNGPAAEVGPSEPSSRVAGFLLFRSRRNPTALFGAGRIDRIPDRVIEVGSRRGFSRFPEVKPATSDGPSGWNWRQQNASRFPEIKGRVSRLKDGRIGRFGWKGQTASLEDFVLTACAVELGLEVPGHHQAGLPIASKSAAAAPGLDLGAEDCADLVSYIGSLPAPAVRQPPESRLATAVRSGEAAFDRIGCAACHKPRLGDVDGLYSDLLLHDMGGDLGDTGSYSIFTPGSPPSDSSDESPLDEPTGSVARAKTGATPAGGATRQEWRTPPLWGVRDSAPYMHDGRARTLEHAIVLHGGEATATIGRYSQLDASERAAIQRFLESLVAPGPGGAAAK